MEVFARVVEAGSLTLAAHALHLSPSAVSKLLARLEARLGVTLMRRSARGLALTVEGERYYDRARSILKDIEEAEELATSRGSPKGLLRVNCNIPFAQHYLMPILPEFLRLHPAITVDLSQSDRTVDLIQAQADVAIRTGHLGDTTLRARKLLSSPRHVVASPAYLERRGRPGSPSQLTRHDCLGFNLRRNLDVWPFRDPSGAACNHLAGGTLRLDNGEAVRQMALAGVGIARLSAFHVGPDIEAGRLIALLEEFNPGDQEPVQALFVDRAHLSDRIRVFIDFIAARVPDMAARRRP
jgi:DNA-binding transcriptional LysR family regulator